MRVDPNYINNLSSAIGTSAAREQRLTDELSSGLRVGTLSDDPVAASANVQLSASLARLDSFVQSSTGVQAQLQVTDSALGEVVTQVTSALSLAVSAGNGTLSADNRAAIAKQISDVRDSVVSLANTSYQGIYVFAGSQGGTKPFTGSTYSGDTITQSIETPDGQSVQTNIPGSAIFSAPGADLLGTLNKLVADVTTGTSADIAADTSNLTNALANVSTQRSTLGSSLSRLTVTSGYAQTQQAQIEAQQSSLLSAAPEQVATDLKTAEVQHQALLSVESALSQTNLFSFLK